jgi:hypothetical protein
MLHHTTEQSTLPGVYDNVELEFDSILQYCNVVGVSAQLSSVDQTPANSKLVEVTVSFVGDLCNIYLSEFISKSIAGSASYVEFTLSLPCWSQEILACDLTWPIN